MKCESKEILLVTLNSTYQHTAFGLRYLYANLGEFQNRAKICEFTISQDVRIIAEQLLAYEPRIIGFGVYIWNTRQILDLVKILKRIRPNLIIVLGGPEVSYEWQDQEISSFANYIIKGEGEVLFYEFCRNVLIGELPESKVIAGGLPDISKIQFPYIYFSDSDIANRILYVEASRGCPYKCEYCLSSLDTSVRSFPLEEFLGQMDLLIQRGARQFKFVDRTFNLSPKTSMAILSFFLERVSLGLFLHFEMVPDRLPFELRDLIAKFPKGSLQFEIGIQTWNPEVAKNVSRRQDYKKIEENFKYLKASTGVHTHADLIVGLPGESLESFANGFDQLWKSSPDEIQVGLLKRLKGTPITRHDQAFGMIYQDHPPFQILSTSTMDFASIQKMVRFSKFWDLYANSGQFSGFIKYISNAARDENKSFFNSFIEFSEFLYSRHPEGHGVALLRLVESAWIYLTEVMKAEKPAAREILVADYSGKTKRDIPNFLKDQGLVGQRIIGQRSSNSTPKRQLRHLKGKNDSASSPIPLGMDQESE